MKTIVLALLMTILYQPSNAQVTKVSLQASGLTCSMCSKAVYNALQKLAFVDKIQVDIKNQEYHISFSDQDAIDFDALSQAVVDAGFSVARFQVTAEITPVKIQKDAHILIGKQYFHFLNASGQALNGTTAFTVVDKSFTSARNYKKYSVLSKKECVQTGRMAACCSGEEVSEQTRVYHVII